jgi:hypothetical protein
MVRMGSPVRDPWMARGQVSTGQHFGCCQQSVSTTPSPRNAWHRVTSADLVAELQRCAAGHGVGEHREGAALASHGRSRWFEPNHAHSEREDQPWLDLSTLLVSGVHDAASVWHNSRQQGGHMGPASASDGVPSTAGTGGYWRATMGHSVPAAWELAWAKTARRVTPSGL